MKLMNNVENGNCVRFFIDDGYLQPIGFRLFVETKPTRNDRERITHGVLHNKCAHNPALNKIRIIGLSK